MTKIVNTTVEQVLKAAENGPQARKLLEELFPEAFKFQLGDMVRYRNPADQSNVYRVLDWSNLEAVLGALQTHKNYMLILHENKNVLYAADPSIMRKV